MALEGAQAVRLFDQECLHMNSMAIAGSNESSGNCHIFDLWLSQWRMAILDCESAKFLLLSILDSMHAMSGQDEFWAQLRRFFDSRNQSNRDVDESDSTADLHDRLRLQASLLTSHEAKLLLEDLSRSSSLNEDRAFWQTAETMINRCDSHENGDGGCCNFRSQ